MGPGRVTEKEESSLIDKSIIEQLRVPPGKKVRLKHYDPGWVQNENLKDQGKGAVKQRAKEVLEKNLSDLEAAQNLLYADNCYAVLIVLQAMDAAGKDGTIKHVMSGVNPQGCQVFSFKQPSREDLDHDFLWRYVKCLPERGRIGIFNRSYYEEVLVVRVHPEILRRQRLPPQSVGKRIWDERLADIAHFEDYLMRQGTILLKFFLHVSREEQKRRFMERLDKPRKHWKFSSADIRERGFWGDYVHAFEEAIRATAAPHAPWFIVPADNKWFTRLVVAAAIVEAVENLDLSYPKIDAAKKKELARARAALARE